LADTIARLLPYWEREIVPALLSGKHPLVVAHGNTLRGLIAHLEGLAPSDVLSLEVPTGVPIVYELDPALRPVRSC
jgi:2,3-bisphosphoglycerate-dependent phosphoglycerate mutase